MKRITKIESSRADILTKPKLQVAAYCRVSTGSDEQLVSLEAQKKHYESYKSESGVGICRPVL